MTDVVAPQAEGASYGTAVVVTTLDQAIPLEVLKVGTLVAVPGPEAFLYKIASVVQAGTQTEPTYHLDNLVKEGDRKVYTLSELRAIRPIGFLTFDKPWEVLEKFVEGGFYQAWPSGTLYTVRQGFLVNAAQGMRVYGTNAADRKNLPKLLPVLVKRWEPPPAAAAPQAPPRR